MLRTGHSAILIGLLLVVAGCGGRSTPSPTAADAEAATPSAKIKWNYDYADGLRKAKEAGKPLMVDVFATWCPPCKHLDETVFSRADVAEASKAFVTVRIDSDKYPQLVDKLKVEAYPTVLFLTPDGKEIGRSLGAVAYQDMLDSMEKAKRRKSNR